MSYSKLQTPQYTSAALNLQLINSLHNNHDLCCGCQNPSEHLLFLLATKVKPTNFTKEEKKQIQKCLGFGDGRTTEDEDTGLEPGDLEKLFAIEDEDIEG